MPSLSLYSAVLALSVALGGFAAGTTHATSAAPARSPNLVSTVVHSDVITVGGEVRIIRRGEYRYFNGRRGYPDYRDGYREYNGFWFPDDAFIGIAIINGIFRQQVRPVYRNRAHVNWCADRYRSYRASSDSYQPYYGGRRRCYSPYN